MTAGELDRKLLAAAERLGRALRAARQTAATRHQLSQLGLQVIQVLADARPRRIGELAAELHVTQPTTSDAVAVLESRDLLVRSRDPLDGRATTVTLTPDGAELAAVIDRELGPVLTGDTTGDADESDRAVALRVLLGEIARLQAAGVISVNRSCLTCAHFRAPGLNEPAHCLLLDRPLPDADLRVDCPDHLAAAPA